MYEMTIDMDNLAKGADVEVDGLGLFKNGETVEVSDEDAENFRLRHQRVEHTFDEEGKLHVEVSPGPTLLEAFRGVDGVEVSVKKEQKPQGNPPKGGAE